MAKAVVAAVDGTMAPEAAKQSTLTVLRLRMSGTAGSDVSGGEHFTVNGTVTVHGGGLEDELGHPLALGHRSIGDARRRIA